MNRFMMMVVAAGMLAAGGAEIKMDEDFRKREEDDIREAVFRYQFEHLVFAEMRKVQNYYLSFGDKGEDPPDKFMSRFSGHKPSVQKVSFSVGSKNFNPARDKKTGERGLVFSISNIKWTSDIEVVVDAWCYAGPLSGFGGEYIVTKQRRGWKVTRTGRIGVS